VSSNIKDYTFEKGNIVFIDEQGSLPVHLVSDSFIEEGNDKEAVRFTHAFRKTGSSGARVLRQLRDEILFKRLGFGIIESHFKGDINPKTLGDQRYFRLYSYHAWAAALEIHYERFPSAREWAIHNLTFDGLAPISRAYVDKTTVKILGTTNNNIVTKPESD
jgi:hypothetical protein